MIANVRKLGEVNMIDLPSSVRLRARRVEEQRVESTFRALPSLSSISPDICNSL
jgi:hypothetical protein